MEKEVVNTKLSCKDFYNALTENDISHFYGVPDSLLAPFIFYLENNAKENHTIAANEGSAVGFAMGYYLATRKVPLVYMQNSGLGNAINPLVSLADKSVMGIPMILLIGWRGEPGIKDESQHLKQGMITRSLLDSLNVPFELLSNDNKNTSSQIENAVRSAKKLERPFAFLVKKNTFLEEADLNLNTVNYPLAREDVLVQIADSLTKSDVIVATAGKASRELFEYRDKTDKSHEQDLLLVGGMGHASSVACGIAEQKPGRKIYLIDGDGALLMHMGALATIGSKKINNFYHFVINNGSHESVGGQPTAGFNIDIPAIAKASGYSYTFLVQDQSELVKVLENIKNIEGKVFIEIRTNKNSRKDLRRPTTHPSQNKESFMSFLDEE